VLQVRSVPTGARITLDGEPIGATDTTFNTYPGAHVVILEKPVYHSETVSINAEEGKTAEVSATMHPSSSGAASTASPPPPSRLIPLTLLGVGGVALVTGGVLVYLGQQDGPDDKTLHTHATTLGVVSGIAGIAAVGTGAYLWWRGNRTSAPVVTTVARGAMVGWAGTF
jgi:hypothetical protein